jgi:cobalt-zinc-cadmium efflux system protein
MGHHSHDHHSHADGHDHAPPKSFSRAFAVGVTLNLVFVVVEVVYGSLSHSMALVADAAHNMGDVLGLGLAWGASALARRRPSKRLTYGLRGSTILASLANALLLLFVTGGIAWESVTRILQPENVAGRTVIVVSLVGVLINGTSALLFMAGRKGDLNVRSAFMHLASDAALALGVAVAGAVILFTGWRWLDPVVSIVLSLLIFWSTWSLLRASTSLALAAVPEGIDPDEVASYLRGLPGVKEVHDLHIWAMSTTDTALTAHLVMADTACHAGFLGDVCATLKKRFGIEHTTVQVEPEEAPTPCALAPSEVV